MEQTIEINEYKAEQKPGMLREAAETLLANLPIIVCGLVIFLALAHDIIL